MARSRRRRRRRSTSPSAGAPPAETPAPSPSGTRPPIAGPPPQAGSAHAPDFPSSGTGEQVWERTHLEQMMFALARDRADAAARSAQAVPHDRAGEQTHSLVSILMSFLALEAFINMVGGDRLGSRYRHYDRMSLEGKWLEVTRLVTKQGKTFDEDGEELRALATLRSWRNMLTHYKGEYEEVQPGSRGGETRVEALLSAENAARALEIAHSLYRAFYTWDRRSPPRQFIWLDDRPHRPQGAAGATPRPAAIQAAAPPAPGAGRATPPRVRSTREALPAARTARAARPDETLGSGLAAGGDARRRRRRRRR